MRIYFSFQTVKDTNHQSWSKTAAHFYTRAGRFQTPTMSLPKLWSMAEPRGMKRISTYRCEEHNGDMSCLTLPDIMTFLAGHCSGKDLLHVCKTRGHVTFDASTDSISQV